MARRRNRPPDEVSGLTDAELIERCRRADPFAPEDDEVNLRRRGAGRAALEDAATPSPEYRRLRGEIGRRLGAMLRAARLARGLTVEQVAGPVNAGRLADTEQGRFWWGVHPDLYEEICTKGGFGPGRPTPKELGLYLLSGHPFCRTIRPASVDPAWLLANGGVVADLARSIARGRSFELLPVLGDALEEAGCDDPAILSHCRTPGDHVIGCWVTDALVMAGRGR